MIIKKIKYKKPILMFLTGMLLFIIGCLGGNQYIKQGRKTAAAGDWDKSVEIFQEACKANPDDMEAKMMLIKSRWKASMIHIIKGKALLEKKNVDDAILEFKKSIDLNPDNRKAYFLIKKADNIKKSDQFFIEGQNLLKERKYLQARKVFQKAVRLNPENKEAVTALGYYRKLGEGAPKFRLKYKTDIPVSLKFKQTPIINVFEVLTKIAGINFIFDKDMQESKVTLFMNDVSFDRFLEVLLKTNDLAARAVDEKTLIIYPDTPAKVKEYQDLKVRTFYLANLKAQKAIGLLSKILKARDITANEKLNSLVVRGSKEVIEIASKIIEANDRLPAEVLMNVEILEVSKTKEQQFGLEYSKSFTIGIGETTDGISSDTGLVGWISMADLDKLSNKELIMTTPQATLNLLKQDTDTKILANPQLRVKNGEKASILIGERIPLRVNRRVDSSTGDVTSDYQYHDVGVKMEVEPVINMDGEISMSILLDVSSLGPNVGTADDPQYSINTRTAQSVLTVKDGDSVIFGGLIKDIERETIRKVPLIGDIPVIGHLFSNQDSNNLETDIIMVIKPVIIRNQTVPEQDIVEMWSGKEKSFSLREPYESYAVQHDKYLDRPEKQHLEKLLSDIHKVINHDKAEVIIGN
jgi:general secretion pathway protein D